MKMKNLLMTIIAILGLAMFTFAQTIPSYIPTDGLVGWWPFNGNAIDESGNNNNGTVNGALLTTDRFGTSNNAYSFDGIDDYIEVQNNSSLNVTIWSISAWVNPSGYYLGNVNGNVSDGNVVVGKGTDFNSGFYSLSYKSQSLKARGSFGIGNLPNFVDNSTSITSNQWHHVLVSWDGVSMRIYTNGQLENTNSNITTAQGVNNQNLFFGTMAANNLYPYWVNGIIDDIGIWNRALTQEEITNLYNAQNCSNNLTISPASYQLQTGNTATFSATTSDANPNFIWQSDLGQGFQTLNEFGTYSGTSSATLNISNVQLPNHTQPIRAISTSGECIDTSNVATINITDTCIVTINDTITTLISVTDTLVINTLITGLTPPNNLNTIKVFPNPANSHITIDFGNFESMNGYTLTITNSIGQTVYTTPINEQSSYIDLATWGGNGIYYVQIIDSQNNTIENRKIVLQ